MGTDNNNRHSSVRRVIVIENNTGNKSDSFEIEARDFIACGDGVLAIRDVDNMNALILGPEEWSKAYYAGTKLTAYDKKMDEGGSGKRGRLILIENTSGSKSGVSQIEARDFITCGDGVLAVRDNQGMNVLILGPEEWSRAYYEGTRLVPSKKSANV